MYRQRNFVMFTRWCTFFANVCYVSGYFVWKRACSSFCFRKCNPFAYLICYYVKCLKCKVYVAFSLPSLSFYAKLSKKHTIKQPVFIECSSYCFPKDTATTRPRPREDTSHSSRGLSWSLPSSLFPRIESRVFVHQKTFVRKYAILTGYFVCIFAFCMCWIVLRESSSNEAVCQMPVVSYPKSSSNHNHDGWLI